MIPKIEFIYSYVYDQKWNKVKEEDKIPIEIVKKYTNDIDKLWREKEVKILKEISKTSGLKWKERKIKAYIIRTGKCFSDPLTVRYFKNKKDFIDVLVHELIHQIQIQSGGKFKLWKKYLDKKYPKESKLTINHILLHSIHKKIYLNLFNKKRLKHNIRIDDKHIGYKRA